MAAIDWPATLPVARLGTVRDSYVAAYTEDSASVGPGRRRKRFTRTPRMWEFEMILTDAGAATLRTFIETTTDGGVATFDWTHPATNVEYEVRFAQIPSIEDLSDSIWRVAVSLEEV